MGRPKGYESTLKSDDARRNGRRVAVKPSLVSAVASSGSDLGDLVEKLLRSHLNGEIAPGVDPLEEPKEVEEPREGTGVNRRAITEQEKELYCLLESNSQLAYAIVSKHIDFDGTMKDKAYDCWGQFSNDFYPCIPVDTFEIVCQVIEDRKAEALQYQEDLESERKREVPDEEAKAVIAQMPFRVCVEKESLAGPSKYWVEKEFKCVFKKLKAKVRQEKLSTRYTLEDVSRALLWLSIDECVWWRKDASGPTLSSAVFAGKREGFTDLDVLLIQVLIDRDKEKAEALRPTEAELKELDKMVSWAN